MSRDPVTVAVQQDGGRLVIDFSAPLNLAPVVFEGDVPVSFGVLIDWSRANGGVIGNQHATLANLEPGSSWRQTAVTGGSISMHREEAGASVFFPASSAMVWGRGYGH